MHVTLSDSPTLLPSAVSGIKFGDLITNSIFRGEFFVDISNPIIHFATYDVAISESIHNIGNDLKNDTAINETNVPALELLEMLFDFRDRAEVVTFLQANPGVSPLLVEAYVAILNYFSSTQLFLTVISGVEEDSAEQILLSIAVSLDPEDAYSLLKKFDYEWWLNQVGEVANLVCIDVELY